MLSLLLALLLSPTGEAGKITGGHEAKPHSHPYMVFLEYHVSEKSFMCGGLLVREDFMLTAAHCWGSPALSQAVLFPYGSWPVFPVTPPPSLLSVQLNQRPLRDHNIYQQERTQQVIPVRRAIPPRGYDHNKWVNAIMLLQYDPFSCPRELRRKAYLTAAVSPIRLPWRRELVKPGMVCSVAGWGHLGVNNPVAEKLQEGIVSFGEENGTPPNVYTRVSSFLYWIQKTMSYCKLQGAD
ncbi:mast cell protease 3-like [Balaenoptera ricei]|uniref:mast cell protease 3-like n=1 Tax=Balaenoptera ricei TaxID=2746895 RepID=UPI0028BEBF5F|nr:mast cell protease 3-like [Balaenoptera ricei]